MQTRTDKMKSGKIYQVYLDGNNETLFEGSRNKCLEYIRISIGRNAYKTGRARVGRLIWEKE